MQVKVARFDLGQWLTTRYLPDSHQAQGTNRRDREIERCWVKATAALWIDADQCRLVLPAPFSAAAMPI
jgi:hypothetical protein